jgi:hypothetical protein
MRAPYNSQQLGLLPMVLTGMLVICLVLQLVLVEWLSNIVLEHQNPNRYNVPTNPLLHLDHPELQLMVRQKLLDATATANATTRGRQRVQVMVPPPPPNVNNSHWAYAFLLSGVHPEEPAYRGFLYNILVACEILRNSQTKADILLLVQMNARSALSALPDNEASWLQEQFHVHIHYLPATRRNNFYQAQYQKFEILKHQFTKYKRILYLDADVMPLCNLDYLFELSETGRLQENVLLAWWNEPASGGFFLLTPGPGKFETIQQLIASQELKASQTQDFNEVQGWGHDMSSTSMGQEQDEWRATPAWPATDTIEAIRGLHGTTWKWPGVFGDQGLLYYWTKYYLQDVSIINIDTIEHWTTDIHGDLIKERVEDASILLPYSCLPDGMDQKGQYASSLHPMFVNKVPYRDFVHFTYNLKPWIDANAAPSSVTTQPTSSTEYWFSILCKLQERFQIGLDLEQPLSFPSPLGSYPKLTDMIRAGRMRE